MKLCAKSLIRTKMHGDTNLQNRPIASLVVWPFIGAQCLNFWNSIQQPTMMMERKRNLSLAAYLSARKLKTHLHRKKIYPQACDLCFPDSLVLFNLVSMFSNSIWALKLERFSILSLLFHWNRFYFIAAAIFFPVFQPGRKFRFDYMGFFQVFQPGLNCGPGWVLLHVIANLISWEIVPETGLKFQPGSPGWNFSAGWNLPCNQALNYLNLRALN